MNNNFPALNIIIIANKINIKNDFINSPENVDFSSFNKILNANKNKKNEYINFMNIGDNSSQIFNNINSLTSINNDLIKNLDNKFVVNNKKKNVNTI